MKSNRPAGQGAELLTENAKTLPRREFLKQAAVAVGAAAPVGQWAGAGGVDPQPEGQGASTAASRPSALAEGEIRYPRVFRGSKLKMISFPLGGVCAGSLGLGGRGQLRDWEIFNRPNKGFSPNYAFPACWVQSGDAAPAAHVLESRILPPYEGEDGLGWQNVPGLSRLKGATFTGQYPLAHIDFEQPGIPVQIGLDAFSPFIPHDPDDSGLPVAILRYRVQNTGEVPAKVSIAFSIDNPVLDGAADRFASGKVQESRVNEYRAERGLTGLLMTNPGIGKDSPVHGSFVLGAITEPEMRLTWWGGWPKGKWWNSPLLFWDEFSRSGELDNQPAEQSKVGALCQSRTIAPGQAGEYTFLLAWHFPNRTPDWCGWKAPAGHEKTVIGNHYSTRFRDAWEAALYTAGNLDRLEARTCAFEGALRESTIPEVVIEAASANLSTLASTTCFRTADGEFHGFEGSYDKLGCCYGNCTHVWSYETATAFLFPTFARSLRRAAFGYSEDEEGGIHCRQLLPGGVMRDEIIAADGQWGQVMHAYLDWKLSGDRQFLEEIWPRVRLAISFAWIQGGWDPEKSGIATGVQNNTYDIAFFGPNPLCGIYYLGALRAAEEMAMAAGDDASGRTYRRLFEQGSRWIDANLFNAEFYVQEVRSYRMDQIHPSLRVGADGFNPEDPQYQAGKGCLIDQLVGQYLAQVANLGQLLSADHLRAALDSIYRYNHKPTLVEHNNVERVFALNDEAAMVICDYGTSARPRIPFPYFAEVMTGCEHEVCALMIFSGMTDEGVECIQDIRARFDGEKRNPWDEAECGHHYARAMASWSSVVAVSGFDYDGRQDAIVAVPRVPHQTFRCFWSNGSGWGVFSYASAGNGVRFELQVIAGTLRCRSCRISGGGRTSSARLGDERASHTTEAAAEGGTTFRFAETLMLREGATLRLEVTR